MQNLRRSLYRFTRLSSTVDIHTDLCPNQKFCLCQIQPDPGILPDYDNLGTEKFIITWQKWKNKLSGRL